MIADYVWLGFFILFSRQFVIYSFSIDFLNEIWSFHWNSCSRSFFFCKLDRFFYWKWRYLKSNFLFFYQRKSNKENIPSSGTNIRFQRKSVAKRTFPKKTFMNCSNSNFRDSSNKNLGLYVNSRLFSLGKTQRENERFKKGEHHQFNNSRLSTHNEWSERQYH